jgi:hypothetical protein
MVEISAEVDLMPDDTMKRLWNKNSAPLIFGVRLSCEVEM